MVDVPVRGGRLAGVGTGLLAALSVHGSWDFAAGVAAHDRDVALGREADGRQRLDSEVVVLHAGVDGTEGQGVEDEHGGTGCERVED